MGGDYFALCLALEELARVDSSVAITARGRGVARRDADLPVRHRRAAGALAARARGRYGAGRVRADRARRRLGRGRHPHHRPARRRRVGDQRVEGVHHQLRHRHHQHRHGHRGHRRRGPTAARRSPRSWCPAGHARVHGLAEVLQGRLERLGHPRAVLRRRPGARGEPARRARAAATPSSCPSSTRAGSRSRRCRSGSPRAASTSRCATPTSARRSATRSASTRRSSSRSPTWRRGRTPPGSPTTRPRRRCCAGEPFKKEAAIAKLVASNAAMDNARDATQIFGGYGFMNEYPVGPVLPRREDPGDRRGHLARCSGC